jgi:glycosyltransferase involved in cell wall biosynthesis
VFVEEWKGFAAQKNSAIDKASGDWVLLLDADEEIEADLAANIASLLTASRFASKEDDELEKMRDKLEKNPDGWNADTDALELQMAEEEGRPSGFKTFGPREAGLRIPRKNLFLGRWIKHGGFWPDRKLRLFRRGSGHVDERAVHETVKVEGPTGTLKGALIHHAYPTLSSYIEHMNRYSSLGAEMAGPRGFNLINIYIRPQLTFFYNYFLRLGFLDGREGLLLHLYHAVYVSWKYAKAWEMSRQKKQ